MNANKNETNKNPSFDILQTAKTQFETVKRHAQVRVQASDVINLGFHSAKTWKYP